MDSINQLIGDVSWTWKSEETNWMLVGIGIFDEVNRSRGIGYFAIKAWWSFLRKEKNWLD